SAAAVDTLSVLAPSPPVPHVSIASAGTPETRVMCARSIFAAPVSSSTDSPFMRSATATPASCAGVMRPALSHERASSRDGHPREEVAEEALALDGQDRLGMELHTLDEELAMADTHDLALVGPGGPHELGGHRRRIDDQRVIARGLERVRQSGEEAFPGVSDRRRLA